MISKDYRRASGEQLSSVPAVRKLFNTILSLPSIDKLKSSVWCGAARDNRHAISKRSRHTPYWVSCVFSDFQVKDVGLYNEMRRARTCIS